MIFQILAYLIVFAVTLQLLLFLFTSVRRASIAREQSELSMQFLKQKVELETLAGQTARDKTTSSWAGTRKFRIDEKVDEGGHICSFYLTAHDGKPLPPFLPGQYLTFSLQIPNQSKPVVRCYSLSDSPHHSDKYRVSIKQLSPPPKQPDAPPGLISNYFHKELNQGDIVDVKCPAGKFYLDTSKHGPVVLIGGGVGVTPVLSMLNNLIHINSKREIWFFYGVINRDDHIMQAHFEQLAREFKNFHLQVCYSDPEKDDKQGTQYQHAERVSVELFKKVLPSNNYDYYICGPQPMMESLITGLNDWGVPKEKIHMEAFGAASVKVRSKIKGNAASEDQNVEEYSITFSRTGKSLKWHPDSGTLLEFAEANNIIIDSGCRAGNCGTCVTAIRSGELDYLEDPGTAIASGSCLTCIAVPKSDIVVDA
jgi:uncharacterized protein